MSSSSSSSSSARSSNSVSVSKTSSSVPVGSRRFPDGFVGPADMPFCKVCWDAGLPVAEYTDHFVKDQPGPDGKVVCPTLLAQKCLKCGLAGHTSSYCSQKNQRETERTVRERDEYVQSKKASGGWETVGQKGTVVKPKPRIEDMEPKSSSSSSSSKSLKPATTTKEQPKHYYGEFSALANEDSSEEEEIRHMPTGVPKPVPKERSVLTGPPPVIEPAKPLSWAQRAAAAAQKPVPSSSSSSFASSVPLTDTRFQLHALCDRVEQSKRAPRRVIHIAAPAATPVAEPANYRGAAAAVATESSKKRKQNSAMVPA